jgi:indolepyruvate ferredoxin oxidoreductase
MERLLIQEYRDLIEQEIAQLSEDRMDHALAIARVPESIRGYSHVKAASVIGARARWTSLKTKVAHGVPSDGAHSALRNSSVDRVTASEDHLRGKSR